MTNTTVAPASRRSEAIRRAGSWCFLAGIVGLVQAAVILAWPHQVPSDRFSYPFNASWHVVAQATFFLQHLLLALAVAVLAGPPVAARAGRTSRAALVAAAVGLSLLAIVELVAMTVASSAVDSSSAKTVSNLYGPPVLLIGVALTVAGVSGLRKGAMARPVPALLIGLGLWVFVGLTPALASGGFVAGRVAIGIWMAGFAALGHTMRR